ncbi:hypothetical protein P7M36_10135 [Vibrio parahaemolyticus]|nr:hypothetical protein [Vibrio parahaemolyticus]HCH1216497.1 hypothetical protein [Vibrio parahaemolyticus]
MHRSISYSEMEFYLPYLNTSSYYVENRDNNGRFFSYYKNNFGGLKLPYGLSVLDLIMRDVNSYDLCIKLPEEYFDEWLGYPNLGTFSDKKSELVSMAGYFDLKIISINREDLINFIHPYDTDLKDAFVDKFKTTHVSSIKEETHSNGRKYRQYEYYLKYWRCYVIYETLNECKYIERYLDKKDGIDKFKSAFDKISNIWNDKYSDAFNRVGTYRSFVARIIFSQLEKSYTWRDVSLFLIEHMKTDVSQLKEDLHLLLCLYAEWIRKNESDKFSDYSVGLKNLKKDIYSLFEWLCFSGVSEKTLLDEWSYKTRDQHLYWQLKDVLEIEEIKLRDCFLSYLPSYTKDIKGLNLGELDLNAIFDSLENFKGFKPWIRSFYDMHSSINRKEEVKFVQPRILDFLLILTVRTEIIVKDIFENLTGDHKDDLKEAFKSITEHIVNNKDKAVLSTVISNLDKTVLRDRAEIFSKIDDLTVGKGKWTELRISYFKLILRFIAARNYFAHHSYKDDELNDSTNALTREVLVACLGTIIFLVSNTTKDNNCSASCA